MFFQCTSTRQIWYDLAFFYGFPHIDFVSSHPTFVWWSRQRVPRRFLILIFLWCAWKWWNSKIFNDSRDPLKCILQNIFAIWNTVYGSMDGWDLLSCTGSLSSFFLFLYAFMFISAGFFGPNLWCCSPSTPFICFCFSLSVLCVMIWFWCCIIVSYGPLKTYLPSSYGWYTGHFLYNFEVFILSQYKKMMLFFSLKKCPLYNTWKYKYKVILEHLH